MDHLMEQLAAIEHERWADWQRYLHGKCSPFIDEHTGAVLGLVIPQPLVERWERQIATSYDGLSEQEKESDREQVRRYLPLFCQSPGTALRRFHLVRDVDLTGVSGTGIVAGGVRFPTGWVALSWFTEVTSVAFYPSIAAIERIHGHGGATRIVWLDEEGSE